MAVVFNLNRGPERGTQQAHKTGTKATWKVSSLSNLHSSKSSKISQLRTIPMESLTLGFNLSKRTDATLNMGGKDAEIDLRICSNMV